jgi:hypothetical protein
LQCAGASDDVLDPSCDIDSLDISELVREIAPKKRVLLRAYPTYTHALQLGEVGAVLETDQSYPLLLSPHPLAIAHLDSDKLVKRDDFRERLTKFLAALVAGADADTLFGEAQLAECIQDFLIAISRCEKWQVSVRHAL